MLTKSTLSLLAAIAAFSFNSVYAAGNESDRSTPRAAPSSPPTEESSTQKSLTKDEALVRGVPEEIFNKADTDKNGVLSAQEIMAYNEKASKER
jgi:hypothetical protein